MAYSHYVGSLLNLRKELDNRIDQEIEEWMRGRADSDSLKESLLYVIENSSALDMCVNGTN